MKNILMQQLASYEAAPDDSRLPHAMQQKLFTGNPE
jgi:hypothetical protein